MTKTITIPTVAPRTVAVMSSVVAVAAWCLFSMTGIASAQTTDTVRVEVRDMSAIASFARSTPCAPYSVTWGDGAETTEEGSDGICIQVIDDVTVTHEYETEGVFDVTVDVGGETYTEEVTVPTTVETFALEDVVSIMSEWVDPSEMMADEEYYIYTITLTSGSEVEVQVAGFTTREWRDQTFQEIGYTGDVQALIERAEQVQDGDTSDTETDAPAPTDPDEEVTTDSSDELRITLIATMKLLVEKLTALLGLQ